MSNNSQKNKKEELLLKRNEILKKLDSLNDAEAKPIWDEYYKLEVELAKLNPQWTEKICPRCYEVIGSTALSRTDNKTEICARCSNDEATREFYKGQSLHGRYYRGNWTEWE